MANSLQIERNPPIAADEWISAVNTIDDSRIDEGDTVRINPATGSEIRIPGRKDAALWFSESKSFISVAEQSCSNRSTGTIRDRPSGKPLSNLPGS
jgi:hypothetical protein